jgi:hypothetical protein
LLIEKELFIFNHFAQKNPQTVMDWNKTAVEGEQAFNKADKRIIEKIVETLFRFISAPQTSDYVEVHNTFVTHNEFHLLELFKHIAIQVNYLKD